MNVYFLKFLFKILVISMYNFSKIQEKKYDKRVEKVRFKYICNKFLMDFY